MAPPRASAWVERFAPLVAAGARVLDLACGYGRHARFFAARGNEAYGRPSNPDFLLERGELLQLAAPGLTVVAFEQGVVCAPEPGAVVQRLAAVGPGRPWPPALPGG
jgi:SAM-dependent methyltransferase